MENKISLYRNAEGIINRLCSQVPAPAVPAPAKDFGPDGHGFTLDFTECGPDDLAGMDFRVLEAAYGIYLDRLDREMEAPGDPDEILQMLEDPELEYAAEMPVAEFLDKTGGLPDGDENLLEAARKRISSFKNVTGRHGHKRTLLMSWASDKPASGTIRFLCPFCSHIARILLKEHLEGGEAWTTPSL